MNNYESKVTFYLSSSLIRNTRKAIKGSTDFEPYKADAVCINKTESNNKAAELTDSIVFTGNITYLIDDLSYSCAEFLINSTYDFISQEKIKLVFQLPDHWKAVNILLMRFQIWEFNLTNKKTIVNDKLNYHGETKGIYPDAWMNMFSIFEMIENLN